jgi:hypothetical protein
MTDHEREQKVKALRKVRRLVDHLERDRLGAHNERTIILVLGALVVALVLSVGLALFLKSMKEKDLEVIQRCEMDHQVSLVWKEMETLKKERPDLRPDELQWLVDRKRPQFKEAAKALCAHK